MKTIYLTFLLTWTNCFLFSQNTQENNIVILSSDSILHISDITINTDHVGVYEKFEITFRLTGKWNNPFDPDQIRVDAIFEKPDGEMVTVPAFFYQDYFLDPGKNKNKAGNPVWKVRFTPEMAGSYSYYIEAINHNDNIKTSKETFTSASYNAHKGYIKISDDNPLYFDFSNGKTFYGIGVDRISADDGGFYKRFATAGGNFNRLFLTNGDFNLHELVQEAGRPDRGLGLIHLENSWNLDKLLELGEALGIYHMLTLTNQYNFNHLWEVHAFNKDNGGMLASKNEYFVNEEAMQYFEKYLRYVIARWGYSTAVFSWDLWNEYSAMGIDVETAVPWHIRMAHYIESVDVFDHIIHTNDGKFNGSDKMHSLPEMEIVSTNTYANKDISYLTSVWTRRMVDKFNKPYVLTEYGMGHGLPQGGYGRMDPERRMVHNGLWSPLVNGSASTGLAWEYNWLNHEIFFNFVKAVDRVVDGIPFSKREWRPVDISSFGFAKPRAPYYTDIIVEGWPGNFELDRSVDPEFYRIDKQGRVEHQESLDARLTGKKEPDRRNATSEVTFKIDYPVNGEFVVYVSELRDTDPTPQLTVTLDGKEVLKKDLLPVERENYHPRIYNQYYPVEVNKGLHDIRISNTGGGQIVTAFELRNYISRTGPDLEVRGLQTSDYILLWLKNRKYTVLHEMNEIPLKTQPEGVLELVNIPEGYWHAEWVNTIDASLIKSELIEVKKGNLLLNTPPVKESIAVRLNKL